MVLYSIMLYYWFIFILTFIMFPTSTLQLMSEGNVLPIPPTLANHPVSRSLTHLKATTSIPLTILRSLCKQPRGRFPHPLDCQKYIDCWDGHVKEERCPEGTVFSDLPGEFCDFLEYVDCGDRAVTFNPESITSRPPCIRFSHHKPVAFIPQFELHEDLDTNRILSSPFEPPSVPGLIKLESGKYYLFVRSKEVNFTTARQMCQRMGLDLVSISSQEENKILENQVTLVELDSPSGIHNNGRFWIGAKYSTKTRSFIWSPTEQEIKLSDWLIGHPEIGEECVHFMQDSSHLGWKSADCSKKLRFICQWYPPTKL